MHGAFERAGEIASHIPLHLIATSFATVTLPYWREWLRTVSDTATDLAPIVALIALLFSVWATASGQGARAGVAKALGAAGKFTGWSILLVIATLGIWALISVFTSKRADASPAIPAAQTQVPKRRRALDDAGEDGDANDPAADGAADPVWLLPVLDDARTRRLKEVKGKRANPLILRIFADAGHSGIKSDEVSWCAAYVCAQLERANIPSPKTLMARDFLKWGQEVDKPRRGDVCVIWRVRKTSWQGHVFFYLGETDTHVIGAGGNQSDNVTIAKFPKSRLLGYRRPKSLAKSKTIGGAIAGGGASAGVAVAAAAEIEEEASRAEQIAETIDAVTRPAESLQHVLPAGSRWKLYLMLGCAVLGIVAAVIVALERRKHRKQRGI